MERKRSTTDTHPVRSNIQKHRSGRTDRPDARKYRVLVVDDDEAVAEVCSLVLSEAGFDVATFSDALMALQNAVAHPPDVVLTDFSMPKLDGLALAKELRTRCPACRALVMSGQVARLQQTRAGASFITLLQKPLDPSEIVTCVQRALSDVWHQHR